jgi:hypothetical protein
MTKGLSNRFKPAWKKAGKPRPPKLQGNKGRPYGPSRTPKTKG